MTTNENEFQVVLPSNVKCETERRNRTNHFTTCLPHPIDVKKEDWEVALMQINYPHSWHNVTPAACVITFGHHKHRAIQDKQKNLIPSRHYESPHEILKTIDSLKPQWFSGIFRVNEWSKRSEIILDPNNEFSMSRDLSALLGFGSKQTFHNPQRDSAAIKTHTPSAILAEDYDEKHRMVFAAKFGADMRATMYDMFIYSNIVETSLVGNAYVPLLRFVAVDSSHGSYISKLYENPYYLKLQSGFIQEIEIKICDEEGNLVKFEWGKIVIVLKFRRKNKFGYQ